MIFDLVPGELCELVSELYVYTHSFEPIKLIPGDLVVVLSVNRAEGLTVKASFLSPKHGKIVRQTFVLIPNAEGRDGAKTWFKKINTEKD